MGPLARMVKNLYRLVQRPGSHNKCTSACRCRGYKSQARWNYEITNGARQRPPAAAFLSLLMVPAGSAEDRVLTPTADSILYRRRSALALLHGLAA